MNGSRNRKTIGDNAESAACNYLVAQGLKLLARNFRCRGGEIDLVMQHHDSLVFVEVRYRKRTDYGHAAETVTRTKQQRVIRCAQFYMSRHGGWNMAARFDVVSIEGSLCARRIEWISDAFRIDT